MRCFTGAGLHDPLLGNRFSIFAAGAGEHTLTRDEEVVVQEVFSAAPDISSWRSHPRDGRRRLLLVSQDRFVTDSTGPRCGDISRPGG